MRHGVANAKSQPYLQHGGRGRSEPVHQLCAGGRIGLRGSRLGLIRRAARAGERRAHAAEVVAPGDGRARGVQRGGLLLVGVASLGGPQGGLCRMANIAIQRSNGSCQAPTRLMLLLLLRLGWGPS